MKGDFTSQFIELARRVRKLESYRPEEPNVLTLLNGWVQYDDSWGPPQYYRDAVYQVHLSGLIKNGTVANGTVLCNLPIGYRPDKHHGFVVETGGGTSVAGIGVYSTGDVVIRFGAAAPYLFLDGISFRVGDVV